tara:strand:+ start:594 stop:881 length:288 start_codon:yes stop_codon:yes gene_type:complete
LLFVFLIYYIDKKRKCIFKFIILLVIKALSSRPIKIVISAFLSSRHTGRYKVSIRYPLNRLAPLEQPFEGIPAQEHAGMTKVMACGDDEGYGMRG